MSPRTDAPPLYGLVVAGGRGERMGFEKLALQLCGEYVVRQNIALLNRFVDHAFVGIRPDQRNSDALSGLNCIEDAYPSSGPITGVLSAMTAYPDTAWLVLACDTPFANDAAVQTLVASRDPGRRATALMASDGFFEPLFAIYEPTMAPLLRERMDDRRFSLREALADADVRLECVDDDRVLQSVNTPDDLEAARSALDGHANLP